MGRDRDESEMARRARAAEIALAEGGALAALDDLVELNRRHPDPRLERLLVELRHAAFGELDRTPGRPVWPAAFPDPFPALAGLPEVTPAELSAELLGGALVHHGCLRVNGLVSAEEASRFVEEIDRVFDARDRAAQGAGLDTAEPGYVPFAPGQEKAAGFGSPGFVRAVDAPRLLSSVASVFSDSGVLAAVTGYFRERPAMIANKWVLRRTPTGKVGTDFHQDGAFLGEGIRTVDCWISLSHCGPGTGRPAIDLVPRRFHAILPSTQDAAFSWSVTEATVEAAAGGTPVVSPVFRPGDALFFDELLPHRTSSGVDLTVRHAIESWFVAPSSYPAKHTPVVL